MMFTLDGIKEETIGNLHEIAINPAAKSQHKYKALLTFPRRYLQGPSVSQSLVYNFLAYVST